MNNTKYVFALTLLIVSLIFSCKTKEQDPIITIDDANSDIKTENNEGREDDEAQIKSEDEVINNIVNDISYHDEFKGKSMLGHFIYMADAAVFTPCGAKKGIPVQMGTSVYMDLEQAYLNTVEGGTPCFVEILGTIEKLPSYDGGKKVDMLVIDKIIELQYYRDCP